MHKMLVLVAFLALPALAATHTESPYAGEETREIKSLSPQQIDDYLNGRGMGFAKLAELNHFPGPRHVLDMAGALALSDAQENTAEAALQKSVDELRSSIGLWNTTTEFIADGGSVAKSVEGT